MSDIEKLREDVKEVLKLAQEPDAKEGTIPFEDFWTDRILSLEPIASLLKSKKELLDELEISHIKLALKEHYKDEWCSVCDNIARKLGFNS